MAGLRRKRSGRITPKTATAHWPEYAENGLAGICRKVTAGGQTPQIGVLGAAGAVGTMAEATGEDVGFPATRHDLRHGHTFVLTAWRVALMVVLSFLVALGISVFPYGGSSALISEVAADSPDGTVGTGIYFHDQFPDRSRAPDAEQAPTF